MRKPLRSKDEIDVPKARIKPKRRTRTAPAHRAFCFVLMPFSAGFEMIYENAIKPAVETGSSLDCLRADEIYGPRPIMADVWRSINDAAVLIADVTGRNPNVLYELGLAHALHKAVILITQDMDDVPFDLRPIRCLGYAKDRDGRDVLRRKLSRTLLELFTRDRRRTSTLKQDYSVLPRLNVLSSRTEELGPPLLRNRSALMPIEVMAAGASEILASGVTLVSLVGPHHDYFAAQLRAGVSLRFLVVDPESAAWNVWNESQKIPTPEDLDSTLRTLAPLFREKSKGSIEVKLSPFFLPSSLVVSNPTKASGRMNVEFAFTAFSVIDRPHVHLTKAGSAEWFDFFVARFEYLWSISRHWSPK